MHAVREMQGQFRVKGMAARFQWSRRNHVQVIVMLTFVSDMILQELDDVGAKREHVAVGVISVHDVVMRVAIIAQCADLVLVACLV